MLFEGFVEGNQQHRVNGLRWSLDGWVHLANGDSGGNIRSLQTKDEVDIRARDLRIGPDTGQLATTTGLTQFGIERDDFGPLVRHEQLRARAISFCWTIIICDAIRMLRRRRRPCKSSIRRRCCIR